MPHAEQLQTMYYRILRYTPNLIRDEWLNVGLILEQLPLVPLAPGAPAARRGVRMLDDERGFSRLRRLHPSADDALLRSLAPELESRLRGTEKQAGEYLAKLEDSLSNVLQFSPRRAVLAEDFEAEMDRLYREHVAPPSQTRTGIVESTKEWIRSRLKDVFVRRRILDKMQRGVRVDEFTQPGDPFHIDYAYRYNGMRGYLHAVPLGRDFSNAKVYAYTAERIRAKSSQAEFSAVTEVAPSPENRHHEFILRLFAEQEIKVLPLNRLEAFAESLSPRLR